MPRKHKPKIDPATLTGIQRLIWDHEHLTNDVEKVKAAQKVSKAFRDAGGCGWCWSELHAHADCNAVSVTVGNNQFG